jgi:hypothetical protein
MVRISGSFALLAALAWMTAAAAQEKKEEKKGAAKSGKVIGTLVDKRENFIEVKADGEEKARRYVPHWVGGAPAQGGGPDKKMLKKFAELKVGSRVEVEWEFEERLRAVNVKVLKGPHADKQEPSSDKKGTTVGVVTGKGDKFIELRGDGEERGRKYYARYLVGPPAGFDKEILGQFEKLTIGSRVQVEWVSTSHGPQIHKVNVLKAAATK